MQLYGFVTGYFITMFCHLTENALEGADCNPSLISVCSLMVSSYYPLASDILFLVQIGVAIYTIANIPCGEAKLVSPLPHISGEETETYNITEIDDFKTLQKIGKQKNYPSYGHYKLTKNLAGNNCTYPIIENFSGSLDGAGHSISEHRGCLIRKLEGYGIVGNIIFNNSSNIDASCSPLVASIISDHALLINIRILNYEVYLGLSNEVSMFANSITGQARIEGCSVVDSNITIHETNTVFGFFVVHMNDNALVTNNAIIHSSIYSKSAKQIVNVGSAVYLNNKSRLSNITAVNCTFTIDTYGYNSIGGIFLNNYSQSNNILAIGCKITILHRQHSFGVGGGIVTYNSRASSNNNMVIGCNFTAKSEGEINIAVGLGKSANPGQSTNNIAVDSNFKTVGRQSFTAIGIGKTWTNTVADRISRHMAINTRIEVLGDASDCHIVVGNFPDNSRKSYYVAINSTFVTLERLEIVTFSGGHNRFTICQNLSGHIPQILNDNCTLNQQVVDSYVNKLTTWNTKILDIGRTVKIPIAPMTTSVPIPEDRVSTSVKSLDFRNVTTTWNTEKNIFKIEYVGPIVIASTAVLLITYSYFSGYKKGKRSWKLLRHPLSCLWRTSERQENMTVSFSTRRRRNNESIHDQSLADGDQLLATNSADNDPPPPYITSPPPYTKYP